LKNLRVDQGLLDSLGWEEMVCADTMINFIEDRRSNAKNRRVNDQLSVNGDAGSERDRVHVLIMTRRIWTVGRTARHIRIKAANK